MMLMPPTAGIAVKRGAHEVGEPARASGGAKLKEGAVWGNVASKQRMRVSY
jgi:hypothetical protein